MKQIIANNRRSILGLGGILLVGLVTMSFQDTPYMNKMLNQPAVQADTLPQIEADRALKMKELDDVMLALDENMIRLGEQLKKIDVNKIQADVTLSLKDLDIEKMLAGVDVAIKSIDFDQLEASIKSIDMDKLNAEIKLDLDEARKELAQAKIEIRDIDTKELRKELEEARKEIEKSRIEIGKIDTDKIMSEARTGINKAKDELKLMKGMFNEMEKDGLIDQKQGFSIEYKEKELWINGKKQSQAVTDKYRKYMKRENFKISIDKD